MGGSPPAEGREESRGAGESGLSHAETEALRAELRLAVEGDPWYGESVHTILDGVDAAAASSRPLANAHTIWEIVLHMTGWAGEVARRLEAAPGGPEAAARVPEEAAPRLPEAGDWPAVGDTRPEAWKSARDAFAAEHRRMSEALARLDPRLLRERVPGPADRSLGSGTSYHEMIVGILQHDAYHSGQIALLKKLPADSSGEDRGVCSPVRAEPTGPSVSGSTPP